MSDPIDLDDIIGASPEPEGQGSTDPAEAADSFADFEFPEFAEETPAAASDDFDDFALPDPPATIRFHCELVERASTAPPGGA